MGVQCGGRGRLCYINIVGGGICGGRVDAYMGRWGICGGWVNCLHTLVGGVYVGDGLIACMDRWGTCGVYIKCLLG